MKSVLRAASGRGAVAFALHLGDGLLEKLAIQVKAYGGDVAALLGSQQVARTAYFQVPHGNFEAGTQFRILFDGGDAFAGVSRGGGGSGEHEVGVGR